MRATAPPYGPPSALLEYMAAAQDAEEWRRQREEALAGLCQHVALLRDLQERQAAQAQYRETLTVVYREILRLTLANAAAAADADDGSLQLSTADVAWLRERTGDICQVSDQLAALADAAVQAAHDFVAQLPAAVSAATNEAAAQERVQAAALAMQLAGTEESTNA